MFPDYESFNSKHKVSLKHIRPLVRRVCERYPSMSNADITSIIKAFLFVLREGLMTGETVELDELFRTLHIPIYVDKRGRIIVKPRIKTVERLKHKP